MRTLDPLSNPEDIRPEQQEPSVSPVQEQPQQTNITEAPNASTPPAQAPSQAISSFNFPEDSPAQAPEAERETGNPQPQIDNQQQAVAPRNDSSSIYSSTLTSEQPVDQRHESSISSLDSSATPISAKLISLITTVTGLYLLVEIVRGMLGSGGSSGLFILLLYGLDSWIGWLLVIISIFQLGTILFASLKLWRGSFAALAFITGISFLYLYQIVFATVIGIYYLTQTSSQFGSGASIPASYYIIMAVSLTYFASLIHCWVRGRKHLF